MTKKKRDTQGRENKEARHKCRQKTRQFKTEAETKEQIYPSYKRKTDCNAIQECQTVIAEDKSIL